MNHQKIIVFDYLVLVHIVAFCKYIPEHGLKYQVLNMMISHLCKIGLNENDLIVIAKDQTHTDGCWRKNFEPAYKHQRKANRQKSGRNWELIWKLSDELIEDLEWCGFDVLTLNTFEADDFYGVLPQVITDKELVFVTSDGDIEQCFHYPNVKIFTPKKKYKLAKGAYKIKPKNFSADKLIAKAAQKQAKDGMEEETTTEEAYDNRLLVNDLIRLPDFVVKPVTAEIKKLDLNVNYNWEELPYAEKFKERIERAYAKTSMITVEDCEAFYVKKELMKKNKLTKERALLKAAKLIEKSKEE